MLTYTIYGNISEQMLYIFTDNYCWFTLVQMLAHVTPHAVYSIMLESHLLQPNHCNAKYTPMNMVWVTNMHCIRYLKVVDSILSTSSAVHMYHAPSDLWFCRNLTDFLFPKALLSPWQQAVRLVMQNRALSPSPMSSRVTTLLFWYVVFLSENQTSPSLGKEKIPMSLCLAMYLKLACFVSKTEIR